MRDDLLSMPADAPAGEAWSLLWSAGFDAPYPQKDMTAAEWLQSLNLNASQWKLIRYRAQEAQTNA